MKYFFTLLIALGASFAIHSQQISVQIVPNIGTVSDGILSVCQGNTVTYEAIVDYGNSSGVDSTSSFGWSIDEQPYFQQIGNTSTNFYHASNVASQVSVFVIDPISGDSVYSELNIQVYGSPNIDELISSNTSWMFLGNTEIISASIIEGEQGYIPPLFGSDQSGQIESGVGYIPDGSGASYDFFTLVEGADPGAVVDVNNTVESIFAVLEHSYMGDLDIELTCPNGNSVLLQMQSGGSCNLGEPWATSAVDGESTNTTPGIGYIYSWLDDATSYMDDGCIPDIEFISGDGPDTYTDSQVQSGSYLPFESLTQLEGCPINGEWILQVTDNIGADNGYIFGWGIEFEEGVLPITNPYFSPLTGLSWADDSTINSNNAGTIEIEPIELGEHTYYLTVTDSTGCTFEIPYVVDVVDPNALVEFENELSININQDGFSISISALNHNEEELLLELFDVSGKLISKETLRNNSTIAAPNSGLYFIRIQKGDGTASTRRIFIE